MFRLLVESHSVGLTQAHRNYNAVVMYVLKITWLLTCMLLIHSLVEHHLQLPGLKGMITLFSCFIKQADKGRVTLHKHLIDTHIYVQFWGIIINAHCNYVT